MRTQPVRQVTGLSHVRPAGILATLLLAATLTGCDQGEPRTGNFPAIAWGISDVLQTPLAGTGI